MGNILYSKHEFVNLINELGIFWTGTSYNPFLKNCNHFTRYIINHLFKNPVYPNYINLFTGFLWIGKFFDPISYLVS